MKPIVQIAIDGPVGSGKSDISASLATTLGFVFIYTGAMYRALALLCQQSGVDTKDAQGALALLSTHTIDLEPPLPDSKKPYRAFIDGKDVTEQLFTPDVDRGSSDVGVIPDVRKFMVRRQQELAKGKSVIMEGRDIGLRVLPEANLKIYLTADPEERAKRRYEQYRRKGTAKTLEEMIEDTKFRDAQDMSRVTDPLQKLPDAWELDTTHMSQDDVIRAIIGELKKRSLI
ncbi:(d)CMP kinase [Candidatus Gottesmanbacteria bacterium]|nr:(d)CMP kinase [Candidatus Gottesmanbacteria bacterium]